MSYLFELGFEEKVFNIIMSSFSNKALDLLEKNKETVSKNINYLKQLGVTNYQEAFLNFYNIFLLDCKMFENIFIKYDTEDLVNKLAKNVAILEYL